MIKMKKKDFDSLIENIAETMFQNQKLDITAKIQEWRNQDNRPAIVNEPPLERDLAVIDPKSQLQPSDENMPVDDPDWSPGNPGELARAMKQMADRVPEAEIEWFYTKLKALIDRAMDQADEARMQPRLGDQL